MIRYAPRQAGKSPGRPAARTQTVCIVDSSPSDYQNWNAMADAHGVRLLILASAEAALRVARTEQIGLWVINTRLSDLAGTDLCSMLKDRDARATVYLVADEYTIEVEREALRHRPSLFGCKGGHREWLHDWLHVVH